MIYKKSEETKGKPPPGVVPDGKDEEADHNLFMSIANKSLKESLEGFSADPNKKKKKKRRSSEPQGNIKSRLSLKVKLNTDGSIDNTDPNQNDDFAKLMNSTPESVGGVSCSKIYEEFVTKYMANGGRDRNISDESASLDIRITNINIEGKLFTVVLDSNGKGGRADLTFMDQPATGSSVTQETYSVASWSGDILGSTP